MTNGTLANSSSPVLSTMDLLMIRMRDLHPDNLRGLFYAVTPAETTFARLADVPDYMEKLLPWMLTITLLSMFTDRKNRYAFNDTVTTIVSGNLYLLFKFSGSVVWITAYSVLYEKVHLVDVDINNPWVWFFCFLSQDLIYYLMHRAMHECGIFWAFHEMHHSSEYFNFSTGLRKNAFLEVGSSVFNMLQAVVVPPQMFLVHRHFVNLYQFWIHNEFTPHLGPLEYILSTPSNHRVHHGRNPYCIDRNYGGVLIIWDRLFGTFAEERAEEKISYGLVENVNTFDQLKMQWSGYDYFWRKKDMLDENGKEYFPGFWNKLCSFFLPVGYFPGMKTRRFLWWKYHADPAYGIPEVDNSVPRYDPPLAFSVKAYIFIQATMIGIFSLEIDHNRSEKIFVVHDIIQRLGWIDLWVQIALVVFTGQTFGYYFDKHPRAMPIDAVRNLLCIIYLLTFFSAPLLAMVLTSIPTLIYFNWDEVSTDVRDTGTHSDRPAIDEGKKKAIQEKWKAG